jgi:heterodisulfide reductase subunit A-like polyferredoxin
VVSGRVFSSIADLQFPAPGEVKFNVIPGTEQVVPADMVIFAIGQSPDLGAQGKATLPVNVQGNLKVDHETTWTGRQGIFAAGDCCTGATSIIEAIAGGQKAAFFIDRYLRGDVLRVRPTPPQDPLAIKVSIPPSRVKEARRPMPLMPVSKRLSNFSEVALGYDREAVIAEANRCLNCAGHLCKDACPYSAPQFAMEEMAKMQKCDLCQERWPLGQKPICVEACPTRALDAGAMETMQGKYGEKREAFGFAYSQVAQPSIVHKEKKPATSKSG